MTPSLVKSHIQSRKVCNMFELTLRFDTDDSIIRDMLQIWIKKGKIRCCQKTDKCGVKCLQCHPLLTEIYEWVGDSI